MIDNEVSDLTRHIQTALHFHFGTCWCSRPCKCRPNSIHITKVCYKRSSTHHIHIYFRKKKKIDEKKSHALWMTKLLLFVILSLACLSSFSSPSLFLWIVLLFSVCLSVHKSSRCAMGVNNTMAVWWSQCENASQLCDSMPVCYVLLNYFLRFGATFLSLDAYTTGPIKRLAQSIFTLARDAFEQRFEYIMFVS